MLEFRVVCLVHWEVAMKITLAPTDGRHIEACVIEVSDNPRLSPQVLLGRARDCDVQLVESSVSRHHCHISVDVAAHSVNICDLGSRNGTFVNKERLAGLRDLHDGDEIVVGNIPLKVQFSECSGDWEWAEARYRAIQIGRRRHVTLADCGSGASRQRSVCPGEDLAARSFASVAAQTSSVPGSRLDSRRN
jgi:hypothetical protein